MDEARSAGSKPIVRQIMPACGARRNLRVTAVTVLDFFRPLRFPRFASSALGGNPQRSQVRVGEPLWRRETRLPIRHFVTPSPTEKAFSLPSSGRKVARVCVTEGERGGQTLR